MITLIWLESGKELKVKGSQVYDAVAYELESGKELKVSLLNVWLDEGEMVWNPERN